MKSFVWLIMIPCIVLGLFYILFSLGNGSFNPKLWDNSKGGWMVINLLYIVIYQIVIFMNWKNLPKLNEN